MMSIRSYNNFPLSEYTPDPIETEEHCSGNFDIAGDACFERWIILSRLEIVLRDYWE